MNYGELQTEYFAYLGELNILTSAITATTPVQATAKRHINAAYQEICSAYDWGWLRDEVRIPYVEQETGTITIGAESLVATIGGGLSLRLSHQGQLLRYEDQLIRIAEVIDGTTCVLASHPGAALVAEDITIYNDVYFFPWDFLSLVSARDEVDQRELIVANPHQMVRAGRLDPDDSGDVAWIDVDFKQLARDQWTDTTVSVTNGSAQVDHAAASWDTFVRTGVSLGDATLKIEGDNREYTIQRFNGNNQLFLTEPYKGTTNATANYAINPMSRRRYRLLPLPNEADQALIIEYLRRPVNMVLDTDEPIDIPEEYHYSVLLTKAIIKAFEQRQLDARALRAEFGEALKDMKQRSGANSTRFGFRMSRMAQGTAVMAGRIDTSATATP